MKFSVLISVYKNDVAEHFKIALKSIVQQTRLPNQIVVVKDGPVDERINDIIESETNENIEVDVIDLPINKGFAIALNEGLKACNYEYVARMDADDISLPSRFEKQINFMKNNPDVSVLSSWIEEFDSDGNVFSLKKLPLTHDEIFDFGKRRNPINHPVSFFKKSAVLNVGGYPLFKKSQDYALWSLLLVNGYKFANMGEVLLKMRAGNKFFERRGNEYFYHEQKILSFQRKIGYINTTQYVSNFTARFLLRSSPSGLKKMIYKIFRK